MSGGKDFMKYGIATTNFNTYSDPHTIADLAARAERAGWEAFFVWDHYAYVWDGRSTGEPWMLLASAAAVTSRISLGTAVSPIPRYMPHALAGIVATFDHLSRGRAILGAAI